MTRVELLVVLAVTFGLSWALCRSFTARPFPRLAVPNYRGLKLNPVLGLALGIPSLGVFAWILASRALAGEWEDRFWAYVWVLAAALLVMAAGLVDDLFRGADRGLRGHMRASLRGRPTTGLLKVVAAVAAGIMVVLALPGRPVAVEVAGVVLIAGSANVFNGLDVAPGRAGRPFLILGAVLPFVGGVSAPQALIFLVWFAALPAIRADLRERGTLGDAGSNLLGFSVGAAFYAAVSDVWVLAGAVAAVALNIVAETVSFSAVIRRNPLLRRFDLWGTTPERRRFWRERTRRTRRL